MRFSTLLLLLSLGPTLLFALLGAPQLNVATLSRTAGPRNAPLLLSFVFWLDSGFYSLADIAGEVENPGRVLPMACAILQPLNMLVSLLPLADPNPNPSPNPNPNPSPSPNPSPTSTLARSRRPRRTTCGSCRAGSNRTRQSATPASRRPAERVR